MKYNCQNCNQDLYELFHSTMDELKPYKYENPRVIIEKQCPSCKHQLKFTVQNQRYLLINSDGTERFIGMD